jgi:hypothetical protein
VAGVTRTLSRGCEGKLLGEFWWKGVSECVLKQ